MRLLVDPLPKLGLFDSELELVVCIREDTPPEVFLMDGKPRPDRHLLLGIMQMIVVAVEEMDRTSLEFTDSCSIRLERNGEKRDIDSHLTVVRSVDGRFGALAIGDPRQVRRLARQAERWFTGTIRLDIP
ncbi:MAG: hypothetical protein HY912_15050 [Desulfomonile tiedjei]|uniref:Uncharacterized protein n=1 Tax=Desulfomonile tiedjei TaxID=2358 RepID=A0A9D6V2C9_9BACT|nr:hypothetical protein [Desulfomonile tiedjei]